MARVAGLKVITTRAEVAAFNARWPCSELRSTRHYWFEFDANRNLIDTDVPHHDDGAASLAMSQDCEALLFDGVQAAWMEG